MTSESKQDWLQHFKKTDALAAAQLALLATKEIVDTTEQVHLSVLDQSSVMRWLTMSTQLVYKSVNAIPIASKAAINPIAKQVHEAALPDHAHQQGQGTTERLNIIAALNGIFGDHFEKLHSPIATHMHIVHPSEQQHSTKLLFIHGLCMDDRAWREELTQPLAESLDCDVWLLRYNSGLSIKENGTALAKVLEEELDSNSSITFVGHSMGGLIALYALLSAAENKLSWFERTRAMASLGTPFAGSPIAHWGRWIENRLQSFPVTVPFATLTKRRSIGIHDLHDGFIDTIPDNYDVPTFCIAGTTHESVDGVIGDGLVTEKSALALPNMHESWVAKNVGHLRLLSDTHVFEKLHQWLKPLHQ